MNERIKELAAKAGLHLDDNGDIIWSKTRYNNEVEKFAELIVRECEQVSLKNSRRDDDMGAIIAKNIKQHFGVEL